MEMTCILQWEKQINAKNNKLLKLERHKNGSIEI